MKILYSLIFITLPFYLKGDYWTQKADFAGDKRKWAFAFSVLNKGYVGCGLDTTATTRKDFWEYDPITNLWTQKADFGGIPRAFCAGMAIDSFGYAGLGGDGTSINDWWKYDPVTNLWIQKANYPGSGTYYIACFSVISKGYVCFGEDSASNYPNEIYEYNPSNDSWLQKNNLPGSGRIMAVAFAINGKGYTGTGNFGGSVINDFWEYDIVLDAWTQKAAIPGNGRIGAGGFSIGNKGYIGAGGGFIGVSDFWQYTPATNQWIQKANVPITSGANNRLGPLSFSIGLKGYIGMGYSTLGNLRFTDLWEYTPDSITGIHDILDISNIFLNPNPFVDKATFYFDKYLTNAKIELYSGNGIFIRKYINVAGYKFTIERNGITSGTYYYNVYEKDKLKARGKFIII